MRGRREREVGTTIGGTPSCRPKVAEGKNNGGYITRRGEITRGKLSPAEIRLSSGGRNNYPVQIFVGALT